MTARQFYDNALTEINKVEAPSLLREDFIYYLNKAIISYADKRYNLYEITQQLTDDLGVLSATTSSIPLSIKVDNVLYKGTVVGILPQEYFHILNCVAEFTLTKSYRCKPKGSILLKGVKKLNSGMVSGLIDNYYNKPSISNPFYYLHNSSTSIPSSNNDPSINNGYRLEGDRKGSINPVKIEIRYGNDDSAIVSKLHVDYLRVPRYITISQDQLDAENDTTQIMEFPDYACYEIIKELVALLMENSSDPRLNTNVPINQAISSMPQPGGKR